MRIRLQHKLLLLLLLVILISLSSSMLLRNLVIRDFKAFAEGRMLDRLYQIQAVLEGRYEQAGGWQRQSVANDLVWAWLSGMELKLYDREDRLVLDTDQAIAGLAPAMRERVIASNARRPLPEADVPFQSYPLFLQGDEIGRVDIRLPRPVHELFFISASNRFLLYSVVGLGCVALVFSFIAARRISHPLQELTAAAEGLAAGEHDRRVAVRSNDEIGSLTASFNRMADTLETQEKLRKQLVSNAAHELRTPLMVIRGELEAIMDGVLPVSQEALQSLHDETVRLAAVLDGVDELTRAQAAALGTLQLQTIQLIPYLEQLVSRFSRQAQEQGVVFDVRGDRSLSAHIDPDQFARIIINLLQNALRAMPDGGSLELAAERSNELIALSVTDSGCGIPADQLPHIFERFYKGKQGGLGLGLAIVKELVEAHKGAITVHSEPGSGTRFLITLPDMQEEQT